MRRRIYFVTAVLVLLSIIQLGLCSDTNYREDDYDFYTDDSPERPSKATKTTTTKTIEPIIEDILDNVTESSSSPSPLLSSSITTTTVINEEPLKPFLTEYPLNVNQSSSSDLTFNNYDNDSIVLTIDGHQIFLINKSDGTNIKYFKYGNIIPVKQSDNLVIYDDNTQELWTINSSSQKNSRVPSRPKQIFVSPSDNNTWIAETSDQLYVSEDSGINWKEIDDSTSSIVLGWSNEANSPAILQHSRHIKLLDLTTHQIVSVVNDVSSTKLFSRYLVTKQLNGNDSISINHVNNLADYSPRSLPSRFQSQGNFYCAIEDIHSGDLLLLFTIDSRSGETNETAFSTCNLISYSKQNSFSLSDINCGLIRNQIASNTIECPKEQTPFYQVRGLSKSVYLANVGSGSNTMVSFDGGITWNRTRYECNRTMNCPNNLSLVISSLVSSNDSPGIVVGKAFDGINEYVAISSDGGRLWRLNLKGKNNIAAVSNPSGLLVTVSNTSQQNLNHSFRYSTDYGRNWHEETFSNETSSQILSLLADRNNIFYILTSNEQNQLNLIRLDFNLLITEHCARHQLKEWSLHNACINGSRLYYKRRASGSRCLEESSKIRSEPCACSLADFQCSPGYKRSKDGTCLPRSHFGYTQDCTCSENNTLLTKSRGYTKSESNQCINGIQNYLSDAYVTRRDPNRRKFLLYGIDSRTQRPTIEIHTNDFDQNDEDEDLPEKAIWQIDPAYELTALAFNEGGKQVYMAIEHEQAATIYRIGKNLRERNRTTKRLVFDSDNELYKSFDEQIEYLTIDWLTQNLYVLVRNRNELQQSIFIFDLRTRQRRTIVRNEHIQPAILLVDPVKSDLYWISHNSPSVLNIGNPQGEIKKQIPLSSTDSTVNYLSYDPISHEIIYVINSNIYALNTLNVHHLSPRMIYEHSSKIENPLFVHPILYFTNEKNQTDSARISLHAVDILAKSYAKNMASFKDLNTLKLFVDMAPIMPTTTNTSGCANNPCSDICIPLEHERFRCICSDDARYQSCSCPLEERFAAGSCQAKNGQCAPGRVLCQNGLNCGESARACEQDHTQYTEAFKNTARCTLDQPNDGFDCYYHTPGNNNTCIPFQWLCDGYHDCPFGNDEEHCHKLTTTVKPVIPISKRCLTNQRFTHLMCGNQCLKIKDVCQNASSIASCSDEFHLHCKQTNEKNQYVCKCRDDQKRCIAMTEPCDDFESCERICRDSIHYANSKSTSFFKSTSITWIILAAAILLILVAAIIVMTLRYRRQRKNVNNIAAPTRTPAAPQTAGSPPMDTRERLLNNGSNANNETR